MPTTANFAFSERSQQQLQRALVTPAVLASPLWLSFGALTGVGVAWWLMNRWTKPINLEALTGTASSIPDTTINIAVADLGTLDIPTDAVAETIVIAQVEAINDVAPEVEVKAEADDLTRLVGVGPKLAIALAERGVTSFAQLAAWTADDLVAIDTELKLLGRPMRNGWVDQAARFVAEGRAGA